MENIDRKATELISAFRKIGDQYLSWEEELVQEKVGELNRRDGAVIFLIGQEGECTMSELAQKIKRTVSSATLIIDRLVDRGLVTRHRSLEDRRVVRVALSSEGANLYTTISDVTRRLARAMLQSLDEREQDTLLTLISKVSAALPRGDM